MKQEYYDLAIIGAGVSGVFASLNASNKYKVCLLDKNNQILKKFMITGKGKSNIANNSDINKFLTNLIGSNKFLYPSLIDFNGNDILNFLNNHHIKYYEKEPHRFHLEDTNEYFRSVIYKLFNNKQNVILKLNTCVIDIQQNSNDSFSIITNKEQIIVAKHLIIATGGMSFKNTGCDGFGYKIAKKLNHQIAPIFPIGVGLYIDDDNIKSLQGLSLDNVNIKVKEDNKFVYEEAGSLMFTHYGIGGPVVRRISGYVSYGLLNNKNMKIEVSFINDKLVNEELNNKNKLNECFKDINKKILKVLLSDFDFSLDLKNTKKEVKNNIINQLSHREFTIKETDSIDVAINTGGGISLKNLNPNSFESRIVNNLFFIGETIDINPRTNGYNITSCISMAMKCINFINKKY